MKVLFVSSGNANTFNSISSIVYNQGKSLEAQGLQVDFFGIKEKGLKGYLKTIPKIRKQIKLNKYDIVHAHFHFSGFAASFACFGLNKPVIVSLMGPYDNSFYGNLKKNFTKFFNYLFWNKVIVKSQEIKNQIGDKKAFVIPNGVDLAQFKLGNQTEYKKKVGFDINKKQIIWASNPKRLEKQFDLAKQAFDLISLKNAELKIINGIPHEKMIDYFLAGDMLLLSSSIEGSPNVIKEAMAVNLPIVTTNVGDVKSVINNTEGCFIVSSNAKELATAIEKCLSFGKRTQGRDKIKHLDSKIIAKQIINLYKKEIL